MSDFCAANEYGRFTSADELNAEIESIICTQLANYAGMCSLYGFTFEWRSNLLCRKYIQSPDSSSTITNISRHIFRASVTNLLYGNNHYSNETNCEAFRIIQKYISDTGRF